MRTCVYCGARYQFTREVTPAVTPVTPVTPAVTPVTPVVTGPGSNVLAAVVAVILGLMVVGVLLTQSCQEERTSPSRPSPPRQVIVDRGLSVPPVAAMPELDLLSAIKLPLGDEAKAEFTLETVDRSQASAVSIYGYVHNSSSFTLARTKVTAVFYDKAGAKVGEGSGYTEDEVIAADARVPLVLRVADVPASYEQLAVEVHPERPGVSPVKVQGLELVTDPPLREGVLGWKFVGTVHNGSGKPVKSVRVDVFGFNNQDRLAGHTFAYASLEALADGATARFDATMVGSKTALKRFEFKVSGQPVP